MIMSVEKLKQLINDSNNIVFFGGAGVSTESNIPDFRSSDGLYTDNNKTRYSPETILTHTFFIKRTKDFYDFYKSKMIYRNATPNDAHYALAKLEKMGKVKVVVTQNIDGLHQQAGSKNVLELHGSVYRNYCMKCRKFFELDYILKSDDIPYCDECNGVVKPDVVLYEEGLDMDIVDRAVNSIANADVLIVGGTSLTVYPAAGLIKYYQGDKLVLLNKSETPFDSQADLIIREKIGETLKQVVS